MPRTVVCKTCGKLFNPAGILNHEKRCAGTFPVYEHTPRARGRDDEVEQLKGGISWLLRMLLYAGRQWLNLVLMFIPYRNPGLWSFVSIPISLILLYKIHLEVWCYFFGDCGIIKTFLEIFNSALFSVNAVIFAYNRMVGVLNKEVPLATDAGKDFVFKTISPLSTDQLSGYSIFKIFSWGGGANETKAATDSTTKAASAAAGTSD